MLSKGLAELMTRAYPHAAWIFLLVAAGALGALINLALPGRTLAAGLAQSAPIPAKGLHYPLPSEWQSAAAVSVDELSRVAPPLQVVDSVGDFRFSFVPAEDGDTLRILPDREPDTLGRSLTLVWPLSGADIDPSLPAGSTVALTAQARAFSPPDGVALIICESEDGETWTSSSVRINQVQWIDYAVARDISVNAVEVQFGIDWQLADGNAWLELRNMEITILPAESEGPEYDLSPTDTPTPVTTPTPPSAAEPVREPAGLLIVVTSTPTPVNVFAAATQVALATDWTRVVGTATPTPENMVTATFTPCPWW